MENNKILIGVQFTKRDIVGELRHKVIELYVVRDITLLQLMEGIKYGLAKMARTSPGELELYRNCLEIYQECYNKRVVDRNGILCYPNILLTSFNGVAPDNRMGVDSHFWITETDKDKALCDLGFITSTRLVFDSSGSFRPEGMLKTEYIIEAFDPMRSGEVFFPEYNISTRQLHRFDDTPVSVIPPTDPPKKPDQDLLKTLLPSILSVGVMMFVRILMSGVSSGSGFSMILWSAATGVTAFISAAISWKKQNEEYVKNLKDWRDRYQDYVDASCREIRNRQEADAAAMDSLYPDMLTLIERDSHGIYAMKKDIYSRAPTDVDFLTFRLGISDEVKSWFEIKGESRDTVFSDAFFEFEKNPSGDEKLRIYLREELEPGKRKENLCSLPGSIARKYAHLKDAPLLYSLKDKGCLGLVDQNIGNALSIGNYFITRMLFELCYYHSPEDLQFVVFFRSEKDPEAIDAVINSYKFMPHFRGLFEDKSQFVFDRESAHLIMSNLLTMMAARREQGGKTPHVVIVVFEEHGMKEHAFAEYLPSAPEDGKDYVNELGLSFVYAVKYREYLPAYCDDIVFMDSHQPKLIPRSNEAEEITFRYNTCTRETERAQIEKFGEKVSHAFRFFSSIHSAQIAQNGKVPSSVTMFDVLSRTDNIEALVRSNWEMTKKEKQVRITKSMKVPIGKTETGLAYLDLHEKADGPHMLAAGTTGSGKTETVLSYLLGLCMTYRPDELNLLLVDMKGGGFTKRIGHLPHVVGTVTDVDGDENGTSAEYMLSRFLDAMKYEIKRRKLLLNQLHVDSADAYISACTDIEAHIRRKKIEGEEAELVRNTAKEKPMTHLILVVDEFTELKRITGDTSTVDYMGEITTLARIGRSLGFHIILISQNIEGAITDDIRVNSKARLCLKVATRQASKEMIGTELAASPQMPGNGRAYLLVGTGSKFEYFQSAYSGANVGQKIGFEITMASKTGAYACFYNSEKDNRAEQNRQSDTKTQLEVIVDAICKVYKDFRTEKIISERKMVFSKPLPTCIAWNAPLQKVMVLSKRERDGK